MKEKKNKHKNKPKTLLHYTSLYAFLGMLKPILESEGKCKDIVIHASQISTMNDRTEGNLVLDAFFTRRGISKTIKEQLSDFQSKEGYAYVVSFCSSRNKEENLIPMWKMYADGGKGICLHFDIKKLEESIKDEKIEMVECQYLNKNRIANIATTLRNNIKKVVDNDKDISCQIKELVMTASKTKMWHWDYEEEYRLITIKRNPHFKTGRFGIVPYQEIYIPISTINKVTIGPMATQDVEKVCLQILIDTLKLEHIDVKTSKLQLQ